MHGARDTSRQWEPIRNGSRDYVDLDVLHSENLRTVADELEFDLGLKEHQRWLVMAWHRLPCWSDSAAGIERLKKSVYLRITIKRPPCSHCQSSKYNQFSWDIILGSEIVHTYKPAPEAYTRACEALGLEPAECMMVAAHNSDLTAARAQDSRLPLSGVQRSTVRTNPSTSSPLTTGKSWQNPFPN